MTKDVSQMQWLVDKKPWFMPSMLGIKVGGFTMSYDLHFRQSFLRGIDTPEKAYEFMQSIREAYHLDRVLVYKTCPKCGWELPAIDFRISGNCQFCDSRDEEALSVSKQNTEQETGK